MDGDVGILETPIFNLDILGVDDAGDVAAVDDRSRDEELPYLRFWLKKFKIAGFQVGAAFCKSLLFAVWNRDNIDNIQDYKLHYSEPSIAGESFKRTAVSLVKYLNNHESRRVFKKKPEG
ncbi:hypothetical protein HAX54_039327 [Datura stramonium]|uniref:Uncharacterized protein n=1 Tax=Datura stramonium TaxID=4076 RepID=A0ABS8SIU6_DATST|nr:hypothetical protein [Datura stramonium]